MTCKEVLNKFKDEFPLANICDYRPICHELFTKDKEGITIWLDNGDVLEYYPKADDVDEAKTRTLVTVDSEGITLWLDNGNALKFCKSD